ncbi:nucleic acid-binding, OB-fold protein [Tanacetum coccineum]
MFRIADPLQTLFFSIVSCNKAPVVAAAHLAMISQPESDHCTVPVFALHIRYHRHRESTFPHRMKTICNATGAQFCSDSVLPSQSMQSTKECPLSVICQDLNHWIVRNQGSSVASRETNLIILGSWLALDRPYVSSSVDSTLDSSEEICLEYGSVTQLYMVPFIRHEEQLFVADLRDKMTCISIYGVVTDIKKTNNQESTFSLRIEDITGGIWAKLHFSKSWSLGKISIGHTIYIAGLTCSMVKHKRLNIDCTKLPTSLIFCLENENNDYKTSIEVSWREKERGSFFVNLSCLPALLNSSCLHKSSTLSDLSAKCSNTHVCRIWLDQIEHCHVNLRYCHASCGHIATKNVGFSCNFCACRCDDDIVRSFHLKVTIADSTGKVVAWCTGHMATELLQISPDEFYDLPEVSSQ